MRIFFCAISVVLFAANVFAQKQLRVLDWKSEQTVNAFLLGKLHEQYDRRRTELTNALKSESSTIAYRDSCKARYRKLLGQFPKKSTLNAEVTGKIQQNGYRIEKVLYESVPDHHVTSSLYIPDGEGPFPAVLLFCGHEDDAKASESYQRTAILFAINGFVVLVIDPVSQGERHQLTDERHQPQTRGGTTEHTLVNAAANLVGSGTVAFQLWDNVRGLDYLESRKEVDKSRIGCLGNSGGGTQTTYFIAYDERVKVAAPCSYVASRERNFEWFGPSDGCQHVPYEGEAGLEISDFLIAFAPKPILILAGKYDFVDYYGTTKAFEEVSGVYQSLDAGNKAKLFTVEDGHGISFPKREAVVKWFRRWLYNDTTVRREEGFNILSKEVLFSTGLPQLNAKFPSERNEFKRTSDLEATFVSTTKHGDLRSRIESVLKIDFSNPTDVEFRGAVDYKGVKFEKFILRKRDHIPLPILLVKPAGDVREVVLWIHDRGKSQLADSVSLLQEYLRHQKAIILADITGVGELSDPEIVNDPKYYNAEYRNAMLGLHVGYPVPALRTSDVITLVDFVVLHTPWKGKPLALHAQGSCSLAGMHAAVIDKRISSIHAIGSIPSFREIIEKPLQRNWYSYVLPGVLLHYDIPDIVKELKGRLILVE
jgi:cephalosporin-C deacetylase-like acetyl esterase